MTGFIAVAALAIYFLPSIIAAINGSRSMRGIFLVNLLLGWSGIGWLVILIVALIN